MNKRLREFFALIVTVSVTFISYTLALPAQAQTALTQHSIVALANADRTANGKGLLVEDPVLKKAAQAKAEDMAKKGYFAHVDPSGNRPWMWFKKFGYYYWSAGENLAVSFDDPAALESAWMNSPTHRANILTGAYKRVGIGIAQGTYQGRPANYIVEFFANPYLGSLAKR